MKGLVGSGPELGAFILLNMNPGLIITGKSQAKLTTAGIKS